MARNAVVEVESQGDIPAFGLMKDAILATIWRPSALLRNR
jgi:hypothetical protein